MAMGHTDRFSLALTTGGPDCADVYEERLHPDDPLRYEYDGQWLPIEVEQIEIPVQIKGARVVRKFTLERTHHGPIVERGEHVAYAARTAYDSQIGLIEQWLQMILSEDLEAGAHMKVRVRAGELEFEIVTKHKALLETV